MSFLLVQCTAMSIFPACFNMYACKIRISLNIYSDFKRTLSHCWHATYFFPILFLWFGPNCCLTESLVVVAVLIDDYGLRIFDFLISTCSITITVSLVSWSARSRFQFTITDFSLFYSTMFITTSAFGMKSTISQFHASLLVVGKPGTKQSSL